MHLCGGSSFPPTATSCEIWPLLLAPPSQVTSAAALLYLAMIAGYDSVGGISNNRPWDINSNPAPALRPAIGATGRDHSPPVQAQCSKGPKYAPR